MPFHSFDANRLWTELVAVACLLLAALQVVDDNELAVAEPKRLRYTLLHVAARVVRHARRTLLKLDRSWPCTPNILGVYDRMTAIPATTA